MKELWMVLPFSEKLVVLFVNIHRVHDELGANSTVLVFSQQQLLRMTLEGYDFNKFSIKAVWKSKTGTYGKSFHEVRL